MPKAFPKSIDETQALLASGEYVADRSLATSLFLSLAMRRPLFLEGEAGVGKTEIAKVVAQAAYEWNYSRQMIEIRLAEAAGVEDKAELGSQIYSDEFLVKRPLARALEGDSPVLLIDELDRTDEPFEAYLLEVLSDWQITIPEIGTIEAKEPPIVIITSNRTREIHDALRRRCLYYWIDFPTLDKEYSIVLARMPETPERLAKQVCTFVRELRSADLFKAPGIAETLDWISSLLALDQIELVEGPVRDTLGALLKYQDDVLKVGGSEMTKYLKKAQGVS